MTGTVLNNMVYLLSLIFIVRMNRKILNDLYGLNVKETFGKLKGIPRMVP